MEFGDCGHRPTSTKLTPSLYVSRETLQRGSGHRKNASDDSPALRCTPALIRPATHRLRPRGGAAGLCRYDVRRYHRVPPYPQVSGIEVVTVPHNFRYRSTVPHNFGYRSRIRTTALSTFGYGISLVDPPDPLMFKSTNDPSLMPSTANSEPRQAGAGSFAL